MLTVINIQISTDKIHVSAIRKYQWHMHLVSSHKDSESVKGDAIKDC